MNLPSSLRYHMYHIQDEQLIGVERQADLQPVAMPRGLAPWVLKSTSTWRSFGGDRFSPTVSSFLECGFCFAQTKAC